MPAAPTPSPCTGVCEIDAATGFCRGCLRTIDEITGWRDADDRARGDITRRLAARRAAGFVTWAKGEQPSKAAVKAAAGR